MYTLLEICQWDIDFKLISILRYKRRQNVYLKHKILMYIFLAIDYYQRIDSQDYFNVIRRIAEIGGGCGKSHCKIDRGEIRVRVGSLRSYLSVKCGDLWTYCVSSMEIFEARKRSVRDVYHQRENQARNDTSKLETRIANGRKASIKSLWLKPTVNRKMRCVELNVTARF